MYRAVAAQKLLNRQQTEIWLCCLGGEIAQTLKTIAEELEQTPPVVSSDDGKEEACECTESDLAATKKTAQSLVRVPIEKKVRSFRAFFDDLAKFNETLARDLRAQMLKSSRSEARASSKLMQYFHDVIDAYPGAEKLKALIEPSFEENPELAAVKYQNAHHIAESFTR